MTNYAFIKPYDIFMPRGSSHFGVTTGDFGQVKILPFPSVFAGAIRSKLVSANPEDLFCVERGMAPLTQTLKESLGSLESPGSFRVCFISLGKYHEGRVEPFFPVPHDIVLSGSKGRLEVNRITPEELPSGILIPRELPMIPVLKGSREKPLNGYWLNAEGYAKYLRGEIPDRGNFCHESTLWKKEMRVGISLDGQTRTVAEGMLYSVEAVCMVNGIGFVVGMNGIDKALENNGVLALGGDARCASFKNVNLEIPALFHKKVVEDKAFKIVLTTPGIFARGWLPDPIKVEENQYFLKSDKFSAKLVCVQINGNEIVSGWNMVLKRPKEAVRVVPAGAIYWFNEFHGDPVALDNFVKEGLFDDETEKQRLAEGYNCAVTACW